MPAEWGMSDDILEANGIRAHMAGTAVRVALHYFNNKADVDRLITFLKNYKG
jgi:selenocysteine lyase/cysteine desulfurase